MLELALGVVGVVEKERRLFLFEHVRIHLDEVAGLGSFVELEAVQPGPQAGDDPVLDEVKRALHLDEAELAAGGYLDLLYVLVQSRQRRTGPDPAASRIAKAVRERVTRPEKRLAR